MLFTSYAFPLFIGVLFLLYYIIPVKYRWMLLLLASYIFYAIAGVKYIAYILLTTVSAYIASVRMDGILACEMPKDRNERKALKEKLKSKCRIPLVICLVLNFGLLFVLKYLNFTVYNINAVLSLFDVSGKLSFMSIALPLGISFYTFQSMGYLIDVYRGKYRCERNIAKFALFVSFFPQLLQGPISRYDELSKTLYSGGRDANIRFGIERILWGYFKKLIIADRIVSAVTAIVTDTGKYYGVYVFVGMLFYAVRLYADFTGGIDITIGIAQVLGIKVTENFDRPYFSKSITEYWRRWHITLGTWFRDYIFYPLSVCRPMLDLSKKARNTLGSGIGKRVPVYIATVVVWFITGIWHGSSWNFVVWGLMNCLVIIVSQECVPLYEKFHKRFKVGKTTWYRAFQVIRTVLLMSSLRMLDCYAGVGLTFKMWASMFTRPDISSLFNGSLLKLGLSYADYIVLAVGTAIMLAVSLIQRKGSVRERISSWHPVWQYALFILLFAAIIVFGAYGEGYDETQFIYTQF